MNAAIFGRYFLDYALLYPSGFLCLACLWEKVRSPRRTACIAAVGITAVCLVCAALCTIFELDSNFLLLPIVLCTFWLLRWRMNAEVTVSQTAFLFSISAVMMAVCSLLSSILNARAEADNPGTVCLLSTSLLRMVLAAVLCTLFWFTVVKWSRWLLREYRGEAFWQSAWPLAAIYAVYLMYCMPKDSAIVLMNRVMIIAVLAAAIAGMVYSLLLAFASINLKADQTIGGTALNLLATAVAVVISKNFSDSGSAKLNYSNKPFLFSIGGLELSIFVPLGIALLIISYIVLYKTRFGLRLRACGEHPQAADSVGINVYKMRYAGVVISGALGAIGGLAYIVPPVQTWNFEVGVAGAGFLAMAVMIFGQWKPFNICGAAMFFAVFKSLANIADSTFLAQLHWSSNIYNMMPFVASMVILAFTSKNSMAPKAEGIPYDKGSR